MFKKSSNFPLMLLLTEQSFGRHLGVSLWARGVEADEK